MNNVNIYQFYDDNYVSLKDYNQLQSNWNSLREWINECLKSNDKWYKTEEEETKPITKESIEALGYACGEIKKCFTNGYNKSLENKPFKEDKKIEKIKSNGTEFYSEYVGVWISKEETTAYCEYLMNKINELIDKINSMENKQ